MQEEGVIIVGVEQALVEPLAGLFVFEVHAHQGPHLQSVTLSDRLGLFAQKLLSTNSFGVIAVNDDKKEGNECAPGLPTIGPVQLELAP